MHKGKNVFNKILVPDKLGWVINMQVNLVNNKIVTYQGMAKRINISEKQLEEKLKKYKIKYRDDITSIPFFQDSAEADEYIEYLNDIYLATYMAEADNDG